MHKNSYILPVCQFKKKRRAKHPKLSRRICLLSYLYKITNVIPVSFGNNCFERTGYFLLLFFMQRLPLKPFGYF